MLQLPQRPAETVPCPQVAKPAGVDAVDAIFGTTPAGFDLNNQPIPMLVYWLKKARAKVDGITADALTAGEYSEADLAAAMTPFNQIFDAIVNAECNSASDVAWQVQAVVDYLDCLETDSIEEAVDATQFRKIAANLKRATAFRQPKKIPGKASKGRRLTRAGLLQRYQSFLIEELFTLSCELYGDPQYALQYVLFDDAVHKALKTGTRKRTDVFLDSVSLTSRARSVLKSLKIDTENVGR
ncbi:hypothetical protein Nham_2410 [Nitrobacter hamburgensis X14]|uniref:Uncharacterized protein n=1 Tax=Nitrobacter hamburgensis (strain DSM 10229 / NCIMB 13809 / X14) TaxID=323097 RepID=Q1QKP6_NITHX|nr:hypothetical protein [Nitrobacter hamburgensis]ABE63201.1 hypothetical protein Nham_2410 [Nitrobacter hamburgensis X14]